MGFWNQLDSFFAESTMAKEHSPARKMILILLFFILNTIILSMDFLPDYLSLSVGQVSDRDVVAPRTVSFVDEPRTKKLEAEVLSGVANVYDLDTGAAVTAEDGVSRIFRAVRAVQADKSLKTPDERLNRLKGMMTGLLPEKTITLLPLITSAEVDQLEENARTILRKYLYRGIRDEELEGIRRQAGSDIEKLGFGVTGSQILTDVIQPQLRPNFVLNQRETELRRQAALRKMEPIRITVKSGQIVVRRGDVVTEEQVQMMMELGLHKAETGIARILGLSLYVLLIMGAMLLSLQRFFPAVFADDRRLLLVSLILLLALAIGRVGHYYSDFVTPIAVGPLLTAILVNPTAAMMVSTMTALFFGIIAEQNVRVFSFVLIGSFAGIFCLAQSGRRHSLVRAGIWVALANVATVITTGLIEEIEYRQILTDSLLGAVGGVGAAILAIGLLPYLEQSFRITTSENLLNLARPNHPLLQRLLLEAPGTYYHSILVGNLAETAADQIGADPVLSRVGAYYHDVGKIQRPFFFVENQANMENPHTKLSPSLSTMIITSHIRDGLEFCREFKLPEVIADIVGQHHGTSLVSYFYKQAAEGEHGECIIEEDFRYEGPKPQTKEAALIMLADSCEAAVRAIGNPNVTRIENTVRRIINERLRDGQLNECDLTLRDLNMIGDIFIRVLCSTCHSRVEYPVDAIRDLERRRPRNGNGNKPGAGKALVAVENRGNTADCAAKNGGVAETGG
ncbi:MAG: HDIG domain-containing protein [Veillonellaceae bacterium]|nr:HDIG domain-containing protein [Veillonellaceae bacterium]